MKHSQTIVKAVSCLVFSAILMFSHAAKALPPCPEDNSSLKNYRIIMALSLIVNNYLL